MYPGHYKEEKYGTNIIQDIARREAEERARLEKAERAKRERRCPTCEMKVTIMIAMVMLLMRCMSSYVGVKMISDDITMV